MSESSEKDKMVTAVEMLAESIGLLAMAISQASQHGEEEDDDSPNIPRPL